MSDSDSGVEPSPFVQYVSAQYAKVYRVYQQVLDPWAPFMVYRWFATAGLLSAFMLRIVYAQGVSLYYLLCTRNIEPDSHFVGQNLSCSGTLVCLFFFNFKDRDFLI